MSVKVAIGADHAGFEEKEKIKETLKSLGVEFVDYGTDSPDSVDYPPFAERVARAVASGEFDRGILFCGSGQGMAIAANKIKGVRAALAWNPEIAALSRRHNDANVLSLPARFIDDETAAETVKAFLNAEFEGGRHQRRVKEIEEIEKETGC
jgi:ribose 5-phosphate isomerase B